MNSIPESDWKYLRGIKGELLEKLCTRINEGSSQIIADPQSSQHEKFLKLYKHVNDENEIVANCFDDWRRSNIIMKLVWLRGQELLTEEQMRRLTEETQRRISPI